MTRTIEAFVGNCVHEFSVCAVGGLIFENTDNFFGTLVNRQQRDIMLTMLACLYIAKGRYRPQDLIGMADDALIAGMAVGILAYSRDDFRAVTLHTPCFNGVIMGAVLMVIRCILPR